ncbi:hypothetical protein H112_00059 [Trichophyton rubrum D6]|uniref:Invertebrate defensins family profile domain-containing protein n=2 Tax=Trichophyton TaxID=5550 RepID=A0A022WH73_TRIRU|nr:hypothetical protein H100_00057 [Trichophyton rubrum MR850]EZF47099.1 hypothetical protein H102_00056 [Trichophyton rubrum CBS 100081]EZF57750.1 hypothetical protein H103_00058 [Trichophyton rubrum CBS 288.86]EZF68321.1 hypothetical protein H104_00056 [Trichophyton rubrum CBS 289.86]EZF79025.1 hypothetical protein H105_00052 [Trichophyton soudanense CBS 452.61]EZF89639.1 hypothetical protein H110_00057 [Trichophyton rubrum MR1448]EZG00478.1 hypothetical protein H113_00059 [Trichophyton rub
MKYTVFLALAALVISVSARCDGSPDPTWRHSGSCPGAGIGSKECNERCQKEGFGCGGCGGFGYRDCWCCSNDCDSKP